MNEMSTKELYARDLANRLPFLLQKFRLILIVEGISDKQFIWSYFQDVDIEPAGDKNTVRRMIHSVTASGEKKRRRIRALVDRDYDFLTERQSNDDLMIYTDANSLETMIWMTDNNTVLRKIVSKLVHVDTLEEVPLSAIYVQTYQAATLLGLIRLANSIHGWNLDFKNFRLQKNMLDDHGCLLAEPVVDEILTCGNGKHQCSRDELLFELEHLQKKDYDHWQVMQGHDLSEAFVFHIRNKCTFYPENWPGWNDLKKAIGDFEERAQGAANEAGLRETDCFRQITEWIDEQS